MSLNSRTSKRPDAGGALASRRARCLRMGISAVVFPVFIGVFVAPTLAQASAISPKAFCDKISVSTVSSLFGLKITLLGALAATPENDVCDFDVGKAIGPRRQGCAGVKKGPESL
ncbi:MAG: hypothetical protein WA580_11270 [Acidimicrobiales bacterium]